jgi:hypothetical protein
MNTLETKILAAIKAVIAQGKPAMNRNGSNCTYIHIGEGDEPQVRCALGHMMSQKDALLIECYSGGSLKEYNREVILKAIGVENTDENYGILRRFQNCHDDIAAGTKSNPTEFARRFKARVKNFLLDNAEHLPNLQNTEF